MKKILLQSIVVIVGIAMGGAASGYLTFHRYARKYAIVRAFAWTGIFAAVSENQYDLNSSERNGTCFTLSISIGRAFSREKSIPL
jgi:hypothetical protein